MIQELTGKPAMVMNTTFWVTTFIFVSVYVAIISEKIHKTTAALVGGALVLALGILSQEEAFYVSSLGIDWNVIFLLISMMIIVNVIKPTGFFEYLAIKGAKFAKGEPVRIMIIFCVITAGVSSVLDNVTTVIMLAPITLHIARMLKVDPVPYLIMEALASNIGGTATLIGDPPNIMIASRARLDFMAFIYHLTPVIIIEMLFFVLAIKLIFRNKLKTTDDIKLKIMELDEKQEIKDAWLLKKSLFILFLVLVGLIFHGLLKLEPATIAFFGAGVLLLIAREANLHTVFADIEWLTIFFFIGLFIVIGGVIKVGLISFLSVKLLALTQGDCFKTSMAVLWFSAFLSAIIDNIPYVATMNPLIVDMAQRMWPNLSGTALLHHPDLMPLWWSLALGACLGGNGTIIGASANVMVVGISEKAGMHISFMRFFKYGFPLMLFSIVIAMAYIWLRYYVLNF